MKNQTLVAYNSKIQKIFIVVILSVATLSLLLIAITIEEFRLLTIAISSVFAIISIIVSFILFSNKSQIAFEVSDEGILLYKRNKQIYIKFDDIKKVKVNDNYGSFDGCIYTKDDKYPIHYLIKNQRKIYEQFVNILHGNNILVDIIPVSVD